MRVAFQFLMLGALVGGGYMLVQAYPEALRDGDAVAFLVFSGILLSAAIFSVSGGRRTPVRDVLINLSIWIVLFLGLVFAYDNRGVIHQAALRTLSTLQPGHPVALSATETILTRERSGHFTAFAIINNQRVHLLVDTGSTDIALPYHEARRLGIDLAELSFDRPVLTANGRAMVAPVTLSQVEVGGIALDNVSASVAEPGRLSGALLGMSFLGRLSEFSFQGDKLLLRE